MSEEAQNTNVSPENVEAANGAVDTNQTVVQKTEAPTAEIKNQLDKANATIETLQQRLDEISNRFKPEYQQTKQVAPSQEFDKDIKDLVKSLRDEDDPDAEQKLMKVIQNQQNMTAQQVRATYDYMTRENSLVAAKPHLKPFVNDIRQRAAQYVDIGWSVDEAMKEIEKEFDSKLQPLLTKKPEQNIVKESSTEVIKQPEGIKGNTGQSPTPPPPQPKAAPTAEDYLRFRLEQRSRQLSRPR